MVADKKCKYCGWTLIGIFDQDGKEYWIHTAGPWFEICLMKRVIIKKMEVHKDESGLSDELTRLGMWNPSKEQLTPSCDEPGKPGKDVQTLGVPLRSCVHCGQWPCECTQMWGV